MNVFERLESEVRSYIRDFPATFVSASGSILKDAEGREYIDFFAGAGVLNYGHNNPLIRDRVLEYLAADGIVHTLDMATGAKEQFLETFGEVILEPRNMVRKIQFPGPTGTNAVEAALKLARKVTGRTEVVSFTGGFHGMTLGALAVTSNPAKRAGAGVALTDAVEMPYDGFRQNTDSLAELADYLDRQGNGPNLPAAAIVETLQGEGGINPASFAWLAGLEQICRARDMLLIVDDIQMGCGRTGPFFSFEPAGIDPDIVCLSKSIGGIGLPMALVLLKPELDVWSPGEHNGTFRGHNLAFVAATAALDYWRDDRLESETARKGEIIEARLQALAERHTTRITSVRGRGMVHGIETGPGELAGKICRAAFERGLIMETSGAEGQVAKIMPPLTISDKTLLSGLDILDEAAVAALS